jgi:hypothetical protein
MSERPKPGSLDSLAAIRAHAKAVQHHGEHDKHHEHEHEEKVGKRAADADFDAILGLVRAKMQKDGKGFSLSRAFGQAEHFLKLPGGFKSRAEGLKRPTVLNNSSAFIAAYGKRLAERLNEGDEPKIDRRVKVKQPPTFFVHAENHHGEAHIRISWAPFVQGGGH